MMHASQNPGLAIKYWNDSACRDLLRKRSARELVFLFDNARRGNYGGAYRGDICRIAVLMTESGFYMDLDVELSSPLINLIDCETTLRIAKGVDKSSLTNAIFATVANTTIMHAAIRNVVTWYRLFDFKVEDEKWDVFKWDVSNQFLGPSTITQAVHSECGCTFRISDYVRWIHRFTDIICPHRAQWICWPNIIRMHKVARVDCSSSVISVQCPQQRRAKYLELEKTGQGKGTILTGGIKSIDSQILGWTRFASCGDWGCGNGGYINHN